MRLYLLLSAAYVKKTLQGEMIKVAFGQGDLCVIDFIILWVKKGGISGSLKGGLLAGDNKMIHQS